MKRTWAIVAAVVIGGLVVGAGYLGFISNRSTASAPIAPLTIAVTTCNVQQTVTAPGSLVNTRTLKLEMPFTGQLAEVSVHAGEAVRQGQTLPRLANRESYEAAVAAAELDLEQAHQSLADVTVGAPSKPRRPNWLMPKRSKTSPKRSAASRRSSRRIWRTTSK